MSSLASRIRDTCFGDEFNMSECSSFIRTRRRLRPSFVGWTFALLIVSVSAFAQPAVQMSGRHPASSSELFATTVIPAFPKSRWLQNDDDNEKLFGFDVTIPYLHNQKRTKQLPDQSEMEKWAQKYCTVSGLRESFGKNQNGFWGDLDPNSTRKLYKSLLPVALLELQQAGVPPQDLAPLAYKARVAAKLYSRERCKIPGRVFSNLLDGWRQFRKYGSFDMTGMSYQQIWDKYADLVLSETEDIDPDDVTTKVCLKILERSCKSNETVDRLFLGKNSKKSDWKELQKIHDELDRDVKLLLQHSTEVSDNHRREAAKFKALRAIAKLKRRLASLQKEKKE
jgi:hypothetical protein